MNDDDLRALRKMWSTSIHDAVYSKQTMPHPLTGSLVPSTERDADLPRRKQSTPVLGYRSWLLYLTDDGWRLRSPQQGTVWDGPILRADNPPDDLSPWTRGTAVWGSHEGNHGIYAWTLIRGPHERYSNDHRAEGVVELMGKVVRHSKGYRAEMCRIKSLQVFGLGEDTQAAVEDLRSTYACEAEPGMEVDEDNVRAVDPDECPVCEERHPADPLACQGDEEGGPLVDRDGHECDSGVAVSPWSDDWASLTRGAPAHPDPTIAHPNVRVEYDTRTGTYTIYHGP